MKAQSTNKTINSERKSRVAEMLERFSDVAKLAELALFALALPVLGLLLFSADPLGINAGFPWAMAAPLVFAARYGSAWGMACALVAALGFYVLTGSIYSEQMTALMMLSVGNLIMCIIIGDVAAAWRERSGRAEAENEYLRHRLKEFSNDYHVLKVSHGQLEEFMAGQRLSLRQALLQAKPMLNAGEEGLQAGGELMAIFAQFCSVQVAGLYAMKSETQVNDSPVATHGNMGDLPLFDPLLRMAIQEGEVVSVKRSSHAEDSHGGGLLAVVPITDSAGTLHGVLAVRDMHFMAFQQENLNVLALLGGYVGDMLTRSRGAAQSRTAWFFAELDTALRFSQSNSVTSSLLCLEFEDKEYVDVVSKMISKNIRSLDASWFPKTADGSVTTVILLPLISETHCNAYLRRVGQAVRDEFGIELQDLLVDVKTMQLTSRDNRESCLAFINESTGYVTTTTDEMPVIAQRRIQRVA